MTVDTSQGLIEIKVDNIAQLFHTLDPFPFRERDLDREAEEYIVSWAREFERRWPIVIRVYHPDSDDQSLVAGELREAFAHYFDDRAQGIQRDLNELFRVGRWSLLVGAITLTGCLLSARFAVHILGGDSLARFLEEGLLILGWVANWRPLEIFLYEWWPIARRRDLYRRLARATIDTRCLPKRPFGELGHSGWLSRYPARGPSVASLSAR